LKAKVLGSIPAIIKFFLFLSYYFSGVGRAKKGHELDLGCVGTMGCSEINDSLSGIKEKRKEFGANCGLSTI